MMRSRLAALAILAALAAGPVFAQAPQPGAAPAAPPAPSGATAAPAQPAARAPLVDINHASKEELDALPGVGPARAEAIIKGRPYKGKDELLRKKVIPSGVYEGIKERIVARQS
ncbi:ComEA family DNA-binding protein [Enterovirga aerilata]|uniref:Helix-hairpin-helix domain-containing protein n=1 Tax=Enterovirga aerilata TaxID=2730920 RepID=A0A849IJ51_9HYPH|nr:helix-hairpin-helix domain-containing protein [Enterovirga sp. DB1703]NNM73973.1 helix-hairpin-helix domain-containing protein [Enterovirga sp. DB1703]